MRQCSVCHKRSQMGGARRLLRGHYNPVNWSRKYPNLQWTKVEGKRAKVCTQCMKKLGKTEVTKRAPAKKAVAAATA